MRSIVSDVTSAVRVDDTDRRPESTGSPPRFHPFAFLGTAWRYRKLIRRLAWRRLEARYRGSFLGLLWTLLYPVLLLGVYTFVFSIVFQLRWGIDQQNNLEFALFVFAGMIVFGIFSEGLSDSSDLIRSHQTYIKQLVFPSEVLPWVSVLVGILSFSSSAVVLVVFHLAVRGAPPWTWLYFPIVLVPLIVLTVGLVYLLSSLSVFLQDIRHLVGLLTTSLLFLSPIFYSHSAIPEKWQSLYFLNPLATILVQTRGVLFEARPVEWISLGKVVLASWLIAWVGWVWFLKTRRSFADVL